MQFTLQNSIYPLSSPDHKQAMTSFISQIGHDTLLQRPTTAICTREMTNELQQTLEYFDQTVLDSHFAPRALILERQTYA